jgi:hypothetical protein
VSHSFFTGYLNYAASGGVAPSACMRTNGAISAATHGESIGFPFSRNTKSFAVSTRRPTMLMSWSPCFPLKSSAERCGNASSNARSCSTVKFADGYIVRKHSSWFSVRVRITFSFEPSTNDYDINGVSGEYRAFL